MHYEYFLCGSAVQTSLTETTRQVDKKDESAQVNKQHNQVLCNTKALIFCQMQVNHCVIRLQA